MLEHDLLGDGIIVYHNGRNYGLAPALMWNPDDCDLTHSCQLADAILDLARVDVRAAADDEVCPTV